MAKLDKQTLKTAVDSALAQAGDELNETAARMAYEMRRDKLAFDLFAASRRRDEKGNRSPISLADAKALADERLNEKPGNLKPETSAPAAA